MRKIYTLFFIFLVFSIKTLAQGKLCIAKLPPASSEDGIGANYSAEKQPLKRIFYVQIDKLKKIQVSETESTCVNNLSIAKKHLIKIYRDTVLRESFWFTFDKRSPKECLWYKGFYQTWSLTNSSCSKLY